MVLATKIAISSIACIGILAGSLFVIIEHIGSVFQRLSSFHLHTGLLSNDPNAKEIYKGKYVEDFLSDFMSTKYGNNQFSWEWTFENKYKKSQPSEGFAGIKDVDGLKKACEKAYTSVKSTENNYLIVEEEGKTIKYLEDQFWSFCSISRMNPNIIEKDRFDFYE